MEEEGEKVEVEEEGEREERGEKREKEGRREKRGGNKSVLVMATHSTVLAWKIPGTGEPHGLPSMGSHRVGHD